eukprot:scaffold239337_cov15-Tisochrysis_lutea.AAC.1
MSHHHIARNEAHAGSQGPRAITVPGLAQSLIQDLPLVVLPPDLSNQLQRRQAEMLSQENQGSAAAQGLKGPKGTVEDH